MSEGPYGFDGPGSYYVDPFFPVEWLLPIAYLALGLMLFWRLRRDFGVGGAIVRAAIGAWFGTLLPAALILIGSLYGGPVLAMELALLLLTMVAAGIGGLRSDHGDTR